MIIREKAHHFICIEQDQHGRLAGALIDPFLSYFLGQDHLMASVQYAIEKHDLGWRAFDAQPLWNDQSKQPYTFIDLPLAIKTVLYRHGVDLVQARNPYAASLCSAHYTTFLQKYDDPIVTQYLQEEAIRREKIRTAYPEVSDQDFAKHLALLQLADHLSLFFCLHHPGQNENHHRYFAKGIPLPEAIANETNRYIQVNWLDEERVRLNNLPSVASFSLHIPERHLSKKQIAEEGIVKSYEKTAIQERKLQLIFD